MSKDFLSCNKGSQLAGSKAYKNKLVSHVKAGAIASSHPTTNYPIGDGSGGFKCFSPSLSLSFVFLLSSLFLLFSSFLSPPSFSSFFFPPFFLFLVLLLRPFLLLMLAIEAEPLAKVACLVTQCVLLKRCHSAILYNKSLLYDDNFSLLSPDWSERERTKNRTLSRSQ